MADTLSRSSPRRSPRTGTVLPEGQPFWIVDGRAYDFTEWMKIHPGGAAWFGPSQGRDISALLHTYHREPARLQKILARYEIQGFTEQDVLPKLGVPPFLLDPGFDAARDLPRLDYRDQGSLLAEIRREVNSRCSQRALKRYDRSFDVVTGLIAAAHVAALGLLIAKLIPAWAFVIIMVLTRTALAGSGHYHLHRRWRDRGRVTMPLGKALFDLNYVGTSLIGTDGHVLLHHPYLGSGADVKKTFFDGMLRLHPLLRVPGYTLHKLGICLTGLPLRGREIARFEAPRGHAPVRADFWLIRAWILAEFAACLVTGHIVAWLIQFAVTLWYNTFLVVASHDFEEAEPEGDLAAIPGPLRDDWAARQICLSYDLSIVGNRWIDLFLSAGLSPHRVHHVLPFQGSGFANLATEAAVRDVCTAAGITWERPRNLIFGRFPAVLTHYLRCAVKPAPAPPPAAPPPPPERRPGPPPAPDPVAPAPGPAARVPGPAARVPGPAARVPGPAARVPGPVARVPGPAGPAPDPAAPPPDPAAPPSRLAAAAQLGELARYTFDGFRGVGV